MYNNEKIDYSKKDFQKLKKYLYENYKVNIVEIKNLNNDYYYPNDNLIELNKTSNNVSKLYSLLHEAGHLILRKNNKKKYFKFFENVANIYKDECLKFKSSCIELLNEEIIAWYIGYNLSKKLKLKVQWKNYAKCMNNCIWVYVKYLYRKQKFERPGCK